MTWLDNGHPAAALLGLAACGLLGWWIPALVARVPEPEPEPEPDTEPDTEPKLDTEPETGGDATVAPAEPSVPKEPYAAIAALPGLAWKGALASGVTGAVIGASVGWSWSLLFLLPLAPVGVALGLIDWRTRLLPTKLLRPAHLVTFVLAGAAALAEHDGSAYLRALVAMLVIRSVFWVMWWIHSAGMGFGDVRLSALLGFSLGYLGWREATVGVYAAFLLFVIPGAVIALVRWDRAFLKARIPFGPFLLAGALVGVAVGDPLMAGLGY